MTDIAVQIGGRLINGLFGAVVLIILARVLSTGQFGAWSTLTTVIFLGGALTDLGFSSVAVTRAASQPEEEAAWLGSLLIVRVVLSAVAALACIAAVVVLDRTPHMLPAGILLSITVALGGFGALAAIFQLRVRNDLGIIVMTINSVAWTGAAAVVAAGHGTLVAFAVAFVAANVTAAAVQAWLAIRRTRISLDAWRERARSLIRVGLPLSVATLLVYSYARADQILVYQCVGQRAAGLYGGAYRMLDQASVIPLSLTTTLYPLLVRAFSESRSRLRVLLQRGFEVLTAVSLGGLVFTIVCGGQLLALLFGDRYRAAGPTLAVLMAAFVLISYSYLNNTMVLLLDLQRATARIAAAGLVLNVAFNLIFLPRWGYVAAAWGTVATELLVLGLITRLTSRALRFRPDVVVAARAALAAAVSVAVLEALRQAGAPLVILIVAFGGAYPALLVLCGGIDLPSTLALVRTRTR